MTDTKLQAAFAAAEEKRRRAAILKDNSTIPMDFSATPLCATAPLRDNIPLDFDPVTNPGVYAEDPIWKRFWKTEGIRALNPDNSVITDQMERFRQAFQIGSSYMERRQAKQIVEQREQIVALQQDLDDQNHQNDLLQVSNRNLGTELAVVKKSLKNYTGAVETL